MKRIHVEIAKKDFQNVMPVVQRVLEEKWDIKNGEHGMKRKMNVSEKSKELTV